MALPADEYPQDRISRLHQFDAELRDEPSGKAWSEGVDGNQLAASC
jgi:hypothetical protein